MVLLTYDYFRYSKEVSVHCKAARVVEMLDEMINKVYITCRQLAILLELFPQGNIWKAENYGTYRVELIVSVYARIIDHQHLDIALNVLEPEEIACLYCRLGYFNMFNPLKPEGSYIINLGRNVEDRQFAKLFVLLSVIEPGINKLKDQSFQWSIEDPPGLKYFFFLCDLCVLWYLIM